MSAIDNLIAGEQALIAALDADDADAIARTSADLASVLAGFEIDAGAERSRAEEAMRLADVARGRINLLSDRLQRRLARLAAITGQSDAPVYGRNARMARR